MQARLSRVLFFALAALLAAGTLDDASARSKKKYKSKPQATSSESWLSGVSRSSRSSLVARDREGTPIIMKGYRSPVMMRDAGEPRSEPNRPVEHPVRIPRGSSTYIPPPNPSPYSSNSPPAAAFIQPPPAPYQPAPITTFSDRVNNAIQAYPLQGGTGNNPSDQQQFIRQRLNQ
ncbi:MAG: hypothetical protein NTV56_18180 [Alphaproteobacteria bacterium]|nr:hypothetical protein [Alphaproteobacteria bacterium]